MHIDIWSDVICPWCYIGKRRFESAMKQLRTEKPVTIRFRSFELDPDAPQQESRSLNQILADKYGISEEEVQRMQANVIEQALEEGLEYNLDQAKSGNSFEAHQLLHLAGKHGLQFELKERLMAAYFTEGKPIGDRDTLIELAVDVGLDRELARQTLEEQTYASAVRHDEQLARQIGVRGVPFFVVDMKYGISGAQPTEHFVEMLANMEKDLGSMGTAENSGE